MTNQAMSDTVTACLPEPTGRDRHGPTWDVPELGATVTVAVVDGEAFVSAFGPADPVDAAEAYALAVLAGVQAVRRIRERAEPDVR